MKTYQIDSSHSTASFSIKHMMIAKVHGGFGKMTGKLVFDPGKPEASSVDVMIEAASIYTREPQRDAHLKSVDFFDVANYPEITFKSTRFTKDGEEEFKITGNLTIHGVTLPVTLEVDGFSDEVKDPWGNVKMAASGKTKIKRKDFGLTWNAALEAGGLLVGDDVNITLDVQFVRVDL